MDNEVSGVGNSYTAKYWQYDPRLGRRWNPDPVTYPWQSTYAVFNNNPLRYIDPLGLFGQDPPKSSLSSGNIPEVFGTAPSFNSAINATAIDNTFVNTLSVMNNTANASRGWGAALNPSFSDVVNAMSESMSAWF